MGISGLHIAVAVAAGLTLGAANAHGTEEHVAAKPRKISTEETAFGRPGDAGRAARTIDVRMSDEMRFDPAVIDVRRGETIRFRVTNSGKTLHEMVIGTSKDLEAHAALMRKFPDMEHEEAYMAHVSPGKTEEIVWQFTKPGQFRFGCLVAGHFEAGMVGEIKVAK